MPLYTLSPLPSPPSPPTNLIPHGRDYSKGMPDQFLLIYKSLLCASSSKLWSVED